MASRSLTDLTPDTRERVERLIDEANRAGIATHVSSTLRTCAEQRDLYARGRGTDTRPRVTGADGCRSWHVWGRAVDLYVMQDGRIVENGNDPRYAKLGEIAESLGMRWGGRFGDPGHFEFHPGLNPWEVCPDPGDCEQLVEGGIPTPDAPPMPQPTPAVAQEGFMVRVLTYVASGVVSAAVIHYMFERND